MTVHPRTVDSKYGLGHERCGESVLRGDGFDGVFQRQHIVGGFERVGKTEINFVLTQRNFVMTDFHIESHRVERAHQIGANDDGFIE